MKKKNLIIDLDGTLYYLFWIKCIMLFIILIYYLFHFWKFKEVLILIYYRKIREKNIKNIVKIQYELVAKKFNVSIDEVKDITEEWLLVRPLKILHVCKDKKLENIIIDFKKNGGKVIIYSDYPTLKKLEVLNIIYDKAYDSTNSKIGVLKPNPKGLNYIIKDNSLRKTETLVIGDRDKKDGACARNCGIDYIIIPQFFRKKKHLLIIKKIRGVFNE